MYFGVLVETCKVTVYRRLILYHEADIVYIIAIHAILCSLTGRERYKEVSGVL